MRQDRKSKGSRGEIEAHQQLWTGHAGPMALIDWMIPKVQESRHGEGAVHLIWRKTLNHIEATKLTSMDEEAALRFLVEELRTGREGCFCLTSSREMPASEALARYRAKDAVEKLFHSLKSEVEVRPIRIWSEDAVFGVLLPGFIAQLMICLTRWTVKPASTVATKFIVAGLRKLTLTVVRMENGLRRRFYSNFDPLNRAILAGFMGET